MVGKRERKGKQGHVAPTDSISMTATGLRSNQLLSAHVHLSFNCRRSPPKASILWRSAFFMVQLSYLYMTTGKTIALTIPTFVSKVMSLLFNMLSRFVIAFLPRGKRLLISWLQLPSVVILKPKKIKSVSFHWHQLGPIFRLYFLKRLILISHSCLIEVTNLEFFIQNCSLDKITRHFSSLNRKLEILD